MNIKKIFKAAFKIKNFALLIGVLVVSYITEYLPFTFIGLAGYIYFVLQTLNGEKFQREYSDIENIDNIEELNSTCQDIYHSVRKKLDKQVLIKIKGILREKDELMNLFYEDKGDYLKQKVVEQSLNLVIAYIRLIFNYNARYRDITSIDANRIMDRINTNERKLCILKDPQAISDVRSANEMDKELLEKIKSEKIQLERISAKLEYIESAIRTFKHQIVTSESTDNTVTEIENVINEAAALDNVLDKSRDDGLRL